MFAQVVHTIEPCHLCSSNDMCRNWRVWPPKTPIPPRDQCHSTAVVTRALCSPWCCSKTLSKRVQK